MCRSQKNGNVMVPPPKPIHNFVLSSGKTAMCCSENNGNVMAPPSKRIHNFVLSSGISAMCRSENNGNVLAPPSKRIHNFVLTSIERYNRDVPLRKERERGGAGTQAHAKIRLAKNLNLTYNAKTIIYHNRITSRKAK